MMTPLDAATEQRIAEFSRQLITFKAANGYSVRKLAELCEVEDKAINTAMNVTQRKAPRGTSIRNYYKISMATGISL